MSPLGQPALQLLEHELDSFEKLEIVHAVRGGNHDLAGDLDALAVRARVGTDDVRSAMQSLTARRILVRDGTRLVLGERARSTELEELMTAYAENPGAILSTLSRLALGRIRSMAATAFADALGVRGRKPHND